MQLQIPLRKLRFGHDAVTAVNARVTGRKDGIETLAANILDRGLIEPLIVMKGDEAYFVSDGNRRLAALQMMYGDTSDEPIECKLRDVDAGGAFEDSLTAAVLAHQLHPVDQYEAYRQLAERGATDEELMRRFGMTEREVRQVKALGGLSPKLREAWRAGEITADVAKAFTLSPSHKAQDKLFAALSKSGSFTAWYVRRELGADDQEVGRMLGFVGIDAYRARGGVATEDLFGTNHVASDVPLLKVMVGERVEAVTAELLASGWAWVALIDDLPSTARFQWSRGKPKELVYEGEEQSRLTKIDAAIARLDEDDQPSGPDYEDQMDALQDERAALVEAVNRRSFTDRQKAKSGCILKFDGGALDIEFGVIKPAEAEKKETARATAAARGEASPAEEPAVSGALTQRLTLQLTTATATALIQDLDLALSVLLAAFASYDGQGVKASVGGLGASKLDLFGAGRENFDASLKMARKMTSQERMQLVAIAAAAALDFQGQPLDQDGKEHGPRAICNALDPKALNAALRGAFDAKDYFGGVNKALNLVAIGEALGADAARQQEKKSKLEIVAFAIANVPETGWLPPQLRAAGYDGPPIAKPAKVEKRGKAAAAGKTAPVKKAAAAKKVATKRSPAKKAKAVKKKGR